MDPYIYGTGSLRSTFGCVLRFASLCVALIISCSWLHSRGAERANVCVRACAISRLFPKAQANTASQRGSDLETQSYGTKRQDRPYIYICIFVCVCVCVCVRACVIVGKYTYIRSCFTIGTRPRAPQYGAPRDQDTRGYDGVGGDEQCLSRCFSRGLVYKKRSCS